MYERSVRVSYPFEGERVILSLGPAWEDGLEPAGRRTRQTDREAKAVVFSDDPFEWDRAVAESADVRGYVVKPDVAGLMWCVGGMLGDRRPSGEAAQEGRFLK